MRPIFLGDPIEQIEDFDREKVARSRGLPLKWQGETYEVQELREGEALALLFVFGCFLFFGGEGGIIQSNIPVSVSYLLLRAK